MNKKLFKLMTKRLFFAILLLTLIFSTVCPYNDEIHVASYVKPRDNN